MSNLAQIREKVRRLTASGPQQLLDAQIDGYINTYYLNDFPQELRLLKLQTNYELTLTRGRAIYPIPWDEFTSFSGPAYIFGYPVWISQNQTEFYNQFNLYDTQVLQTGDGTAGPYVFPAGPTNINPGTVVIFGVDINGDTLTGRDDGLGTILGGFTGSVDYGSGVVQATAIAPIPAGSQLSANFNAMQWSRPNSLLVWDNQFVVRPTPSEPYLLRLQAYRLPTALLGAGSSPDLFQWWQALAFGAAKKIFEDRLDLESQQKIIPLLLEQLLLAQRSTLMQMAQQRPWTPYSRQLQMMSGDNTAGPGYGWWWGG